MYKGSSEVGASGLMIRELDEGPVSRKTVSTSTDVAGDSLWQESVVRAT